MRLAFLSFFTIIAIVDSKVIELKCNPHYDSHAVINLPYRCLNGLTCFFENIDVDEDTNLVLNFDEANYGLDCVGFVNSTINSLPANLFNKYRGVNSLYASKISLLKVPWDTFQNASHMIDMNLSGNKIKILESRVFSPCKKLEKLILNNNEIEEIDMDAFEGLQNLEEINLSNNNLKTIPHKSLSQLKGLKTLNLSNNGLIVKYGQFPTSLVTLDLSYNKLENFTLKSIISLNDLKNLLLNGNQIYRIRQHIFPDNILESLRSLKHIQLSDNEFYCTILADIILWLEKHKIKVQVEAHLIILNSSNILGVGCKEEARPLF